MSKSIITFYDIATNVQPIPSLSPNTIRVRLVLNHKNIPYKSVYLEYTDIEPTCKKIGAAPTSTKPDGQPFYTFPVIHDPSTGAVVSDGPIIVEYLEKTYPDTPKVLPHNTVGLQLAACNKMHSLFFPLLPVYATLVPRFLNPVSADHWRTTRSQYFGKKFEDIAPSREEKALLTRQVKDSLIEIDGLYGKCGGPFMMGEEVSFVDFALGAWFISMRTVLGEDSEDWKEVAAWNDGRWLGLVHLLEKYHREYEA